MNVAQMRQSAEMYCGVAVEDDVLITAVNEALESIGDLGLIFEEETLTGSTPGTWYVLPVTTTNIVNVFKDGAPYSQWQTRGYEIKFSEAGDYVVTLQKMPEYVDAGADIPECHLLFHKAIVTYLRAFIKLTKDDTNQDGHKLMDLFYKEVERISAILQRNRKR